MSPSFWTHPSVAAIAEEGDPIDIIVARARNLIVEATEAGWSGPPFDPIGLADHLGVRVVPTDDVHDARLVPDDGGVRIEFNPNRPAGRRRFSVAHEVGHLLFPDFAQAVRNRQTMDRALGDDWQLEMLCNLAAAELLMPASSLHALDSGRLALADLLGLRKELQVSLESLLLRAVRFTGQPVAMFAASRPHPAGVGPSYRLDYVVGSRRWHPGVGQGHSLTATALADCTAVGFTTSALERWGNEALRVEAVGVPAYPGHRYPRVLGLVAPTQDAPPALDPAINYVVGDATQPRGPGHRIVAHVVNDRAARFHGGFSAALRRRWSHVEQDFAGWASQDPSPRRLGAVHTTPVESGITVAHLVAQAGYGPSAHPRLRYPALRDALAGLGEFAAGAGASVHMPRIGAGQARGNWFVIEDLIVAEVAQRGVPVTVYDLPGARPATDHQQTTLRLR